MIGTVVIGAVVISAAACSSPAPAHEARGARATPTTANATDATTVPATKPPPTASPTTVNPGPGATPPGPPSGPLGAVGWAVGAWQPAGRPVNGTPAVSTALLQPNGGGQAIAAARLETSRLKIVLYAGSNEPAGAWPDRAAVPKGQWPGLVAAFNSGFKLSQSQGGWYADGRAAIALRSGAASLVIYQDGSATVGQWGRDAQLTSNVAAVRQNLDLLVDGGRPAPNVSTNVQPTWGFMLNGVVKNWRSALGVDATGQLLYVGGPGLDPAALADALVAVGAVRAMELDVNPAWVGFDLYTDGPGGAAPAPPAGTKLLPGMNLSANHFLSPSPRDFIAAFAR